MARLYGAAVSADGVGADPLQPAPLPGSTFVAPVRREAGNNALALADALKGFNGDLLRFSAQMTQQEQDPNSNANKDFLNSLAGKTPEELAAMAADGQYRPRIQADALSSLVGVKAAQTYQQDTSKWAGTEFDQNTGDMATELEKRKKAALDALPNDAAKAAFVAGTDTYNQNLIHADIKAKVDTATVRRNDAILTKWGMIVDQGSQGANPWSPEKIADEIIKESKADRAYTQLNGQDANALLYSLALQQAEKGNTALVSALLNNPRAGVGPLSGTTEYATKAQQVIAHSIQVKQALDEKDSYSGLLAKDDLVRNGDLTPDAVEKLKKDHPSLASRNPDWWAADLNQSANIRQANLQKAIDLQTKATLQAESDRQRTEVISGAIAKSRTVGGGSDFQDVTIANREGTGTTTVSKQDQLDAAIKNIEDTSAASEKDMVAKGATPAQAHDQVIKDKLDRYSEAGIVNPNWVTELGRVPAILSSAVANKAPIPKEVTDAAELYRTLYALHPAYAARLLNGKPDAERFLETYRVGVEDQNLTPTQALQMASTPAPASTFSGKELDDALKSMGGGFFGFGDKFAGYEPNATDEATLKSMAQTYSGRMSASQALATAKKKLADTSVVINGRLVRTNDKAFPQDFTQVVPHILDEYAAQHPDDADIPNHVGSDLTVVSDGADQWHIVSKTTGAWVEGGPTITPDTINSYRKRESDKAAVEQFKFNETVRTQGPAVAWFNRLTGVKNQGVGEPTPDAARKYLADQNRATRLQSVINANGLRLGYLHRPDGSWVDTANRDIVRPTIKWTDPEHNIAWERTGEFSMFPVTRIQPAPPAPTKEQNSKADRDQYMQSMQNIGYRGEDLDAAMKAYDERSKPSPSKPDVTGMLNGKPDSGTSGTRSADSTKVKSRDPKVIQRELDQVEGKIDAYSRAKMSPHDTAPLLNQRYQLKEELQNAKASG